MVRYVQTRHMINRRPVANVEGFVVEHAPCIGAAVAAAMPPLKAACMQ